MRRKVFSALMCAAMVTSLFAGCGSSDSSTTASNSGSTTGDGTEAAAEDAVEDATESAESDVVTNTFGDPNGTHLEMWTFVELHGQHYGKMAEYDISVRRYAHKASYRTSGRNRCTGHL